MPLAVSNLAVWQVANQILGPRLPGLLKELNEALAA
jgi:hypothetical protein